MSNKRIQVFLGGPIQHVLGGADGFHPELKSRLTQVIASLEGSGCTVLSAHICERFGGLKMEGKSREVTRRDFAWMRQCDVFVALFPPQKDGKLLLRSDGTCIELGWASALGKPVILIVPEGTQCSHLLLGLGQVTRVRVLDYQQTAARPALLPEAVFQILGQGCQGGGAASGTGR